MFFLNDVLHVLSPAACQTCSARMCRPEDMHMQQRHVMRLLDLMV